MHFQSALVALAVLIASVVVADDNPDVIAKIERMGAFVTRDYTLLGRPVVSIQFSEVDKFKNGYSHLLNAVPNLTSLRILEVHNPNPSFSIAEVEDLTADDVSQLKNLKELTFTDVTIDDLLLNKIGELENLNSLSLGGPITGTSLKEITRLKYLASLDLASSAITDVGLREISKLKNLKWLGLGGSEITDEGLKEIRGLKNLTGLGLSSTRVTNDGLKELRHHQNLSGLDLRSTQISDEGLKEIGKLTELTFLFLDHTNVTDDGLRELANLKHLKQLGLGNKTKTTDAGVAKLLDALPDLKIVPPSVFTVHKDPM